MSNNLIRLKDSTGYKYPVTNSDAVFMSDGTTKLTKKINDISASLDSITINVKSFGAKGDNVTDDTIAFQNAVNYCIENKFNLHIPSGEYLINPVVINNPIVIYGDGMNTKICPYGNLQSIGYWEVNTEFGALFVIEKNSETNILSIENTLDGVRIKDIYFYGRKRLYNADAIHMSITDHCILENIHIEEFKGSAIKFYQARECEFNDINIRYCGKAHNSGEDNITKGHATLHAVEKISDNTNGNQFSNIVVACSYYTALRMMSTTGNYFNNVFIHQIPPVAISNIIAKGLPDLYIDSNGKKGNYEVVQLIDNLGSGKVNFFTNCEFVWGGYDNAIINVKNQIVYFNNVIVGGHINSTNTGGSPNLGKSIKGLNSYLHFNNMQFNSEGTTFDLTNCKLQVKNTLDKDTNLKSYSSAIEYIANNQLPYSLEEITNIKLGGKLTADGRFTYKKETDQNGNYITKHTKLVDENGTPCFEVNGALFLETSPPSTKFDGHIWKEANIIKFKSNQRTSNIGDALNIYSSGSAPTTSIVNGSVWFDTSNKLFKIYIDGTWRTINIS